MIGVRVPLTGKVVLAFVAVITACVLPLQCSLGQTLRLHVHGNLVSELQQRASLLADRVSAAPGSEMQHVIQLHALALRERVTLVGADGTVLFDSQAPSLGNHRDRPEIAAALHGAIGVATRTSLSTGEELVYVAVPLLSASGTVRSVLRLATLLSPIKALVQDAADILKQGVAAGVGLALLLCVLASLHMVRPLRRVRDAAMALQNGEMTVQLNVHTRDEIDDVARALEAVGAQLRARLVQAGSGAVLLEQLVHAMVQGVVVFGADGEVQHINGVARSQLGLRGPHESQRMTHLLQSDAVRRAITESVSDPLGVDMRVPHPVTEEPVDGTVVALRRPGADTLYALMLDVNPAMGISLAEVPQPDDVVVVPLRELMDRALQRIRDDLDEGQLGFSTPDEWPAHSVADASRRVEDVVVETLRCAARSPGGQTRLDLTANIQNGAACVQIPVSLSADAARAMETRIGPLGGRVELQSGRVQLWLPRA
jgi:HAMP domain-containing protein